MSRRLLPLMLGAALTIAAMGAGALTVIEFGLFDVRATTPHGPVVAWAVHKAMRTSMRLHASPVATPRFLSEATIAAGAADYTRDCAMCHGGPGVARREFVSGMNPTPPYLLDSARNWTPAQLYVIVNNGVKMTAMPAWDRTLGSARVWNIVAFLEALPYLSPADYAALTKPASGAPSGSSVALPSALGAPIR